MNAGKYIVINGTRLSRVWISKMVLARISRRVGYCSELSQAVIPKRIQIGLSNAQFYIDRYLYHKIMR